MNTFSALVQLLAKPRRLHALLSFNKKGYLYDIGWFKAFDHKAPVDSDGKPIPWVTYSFIDFISERLNHTQSIFEFGSGNSSYFYAKRAGSVVSVEHDRHWFERMSKNAPKNLEVIFCALEKDGDYARTPERTGKKFDIIIVDGRDRINCCKYAVGCLSAGGVIVLDDSEREEYKAGLDFLKTKGFKQISFSGISPGLSYLKATSVFYKPDNCLGI